MLAEKKVNLILMLEIGQIANKFYVGKQTKADIQTIALACQKKKNIALDS